MGRGIAVVSAQRTARRGIEANSGGAYSGEQEADDRGVDVDSSRRVGTRRHCERSRLPTRSVDPGFKEQVREMLKERMGLTGPEADKLLDSMAQHMQAVHGDQADTVLDRCAAQA